MKRRLIAILLIYLAGSSAALADDDSFTGRFSTNWGIVALTQDGDEVTGAFSGSSFIGKLTGTIDDKGVLHFEWKQTNGVMGKGKFKLSSDGKRITGTWGHDDSETDGGPWKGSRL